MSEKYEKSLDDELDWNQANQYHSAVLKISDNSFEIKKLSIVTITAFITVLVKFTNDKLDLSVFISSYLIIFMFWFIDSVTYYYQVKLRINISNHLKNIKTRNTQNGSDISDTFVIETDRIKNKKYKAALNNSMWVYYILLFFNSIALTLFLSGIIQ